MATFSVNIAENVNVWGGEPTSKWGTAVWGSSNWAFGSEDLIVTVFIGEDDTITLADDWTLKATFVRTFGESLGVAGAMSSQEHFDAAGYKHVFVSDTTEGEERSLTEFSEISGPSDGFSEVSKPSNSWTEE